MRLYELTEQWRQIAEIAFAEMDNGELPADLMEQLATCEGNIDQKLAACCRIVKEMEASKEAFAAEASRLRTKASRCESHADSLKAYMKEQMEACDFSKREVDSIFTVSIQKSPPSLVVSNLDAVPSYLRMWRVVPSTWDVPQERRIDSRGIKDAIKAGAIVPGCEVVCGTHLRIR